MSCRSISPSIFCAIFTVCPRVSASSAAELIVAEAWAEVLAVEVEQIGVHDSFFELGGHSILAIKMLARLQDEFDIDIPVRAVFEQPTIAGLVAEIEFLLREEIERMSDAELSDGTTTGGQQA